MSQIYSHKELVAKLRCGSSSITWAAIQSPEEFILNNLRIQRVDCSIGAKTKWGYVILGDVPEDQRKEVKKRVPKPAPKPNQCVVCSAAVGKYRAIVIQGKLACPTCHRLAFVENDLGVRKKLGVV